MSGCATTQVYHPAESRLFRIDGASYLPLSAIAKLNEMRFHWDASARKAELKNETVHLRFRVGSPVVMVNDETELLDHPVLWHQGMVVVPSSFSKTLADYLGREAERIPPRPPYRIGTVVVDAGHGGRDPGAIGRTGTKEKNLTLDIARRLKNELEAQGIHVIMTRKDDHFVSLYQRTYIANRAKADFFVSIHCNASRSRKVDGFEVYYLSPNVDDTARASVASAEELPIEEEQTSYDTSSAGLKTTLWDLVYSEHRVESAEFAKYVTWAMHKRLPSPNRGVKSARFFVLKGVKMPAILVEAGYLTHRGEEASLKQKAYRQDVAEAIAFGILAYKNEFERTDGFTD
ncbi:MAG: N-acetylmuramoyl-L-alanine amidase [Candidatus Omnitrophica bacterium]|nr:N-acetylmuramoyl-L-alanine amidase [Candidatus Omnitrophota bacterium]